MRSIHELVDMGLEVATSDTSGAKGLAVVGAVIAGASALGVAIDMYVCFSPEGEFLGAFQSEKQAEDAWHMSYSRVGGCEFRSPLIPTYAQGRGAGVNVFQNGVEWVGRITPAVLKDRADHL